MWMRIQKRKALSDSRKLRAELEEIYKKMPKIAYQLPDKEAKEFLLEMNFIFRKYKPHYFVDKKHTMENPQFCFRLLQIVPYMIQEDCPYVLHELGDLIHFHDVLQANVYYSIMDMLNSINGW